MANPQKENGYTPISNEIIENLVKQNLNGTQFRIIMTVWRYTYGFSRKEHALSENFLSKAIGVARQNISREIKPLFVKKILTLEKNPTFDSAAIISFNKDYEQWQQVSNQITGIELETDTQSDNTTGIELDNTTGIESDTQDKQNLKQNLKQKYCDLFDSVWKLYPRKLGKGQVSDTQKQKLFKVGYDELSRCVERYSRSVIGHDEKYIMYGSTFFNSGYVDFLDENYNVLSSHDNSEQNTGTGGRKYQ